MYLFDYIKGHALKKWQLHSKPCLKVCDSNLPSNIDFKFAGCILKCISSASTGMSPVSTAWHWVSADISDRQISLPVVADNSEPNHITQDLITAMMPTT